VGGRESELRQVVPIRRIEASKFSFWNENFFVPFGGTLMLLIAAFVPGPTPVACIVDCGYHEEKDQSAPEYELPEQRSRLQ
jgi:hypothetical protein